ncbi:unnamed protein product [Meganyctiphanes norvegica]|uniref:Chitin-binding type-2 domain-containing protein n=1 Tax=Meganyctiphanes norvegica TaxID=48144 RepID=A0AAV2PX95_MEGNR
MRSSAPTTVYLLLLHLVVALHLVTGQQSFQCPEPFGAFEDPVQCDRYWKCEDGFPIPQLCKDGLVFDYYKAEHTDPCDTPYVVDCLDRKVLQEPTFPSPACPRLYGTFADPDPTICDTYFNCLDGNPNKVVCSPGLHFDENAGNCAWPRDAGRVDCGKKKNACKGNFCCPDGEQLYQDGTVNPHPTYPNLDDCQRFWVCLNGQEAVQEGSCTAGEVFNDVTNKCDYPENVAECLDWYKDHPLFDAVYDDVDGDGLKDFGVRRDFSQTSIN